MDNDNSNENILTDLQAGPVLRGVAAALRREQGDRTPGPGPLYRFVSPGEDENPAHALTLTLTAPVTVSGIVSQWLNRRAATGNSDTIPDRVVLPSGAQWIREPLAEDEPWTGRATPGTADLSRWDLARSVAGRVALVTGAAQGFGWEIARGLAALGAVVALADINLDGAGRRAAELGTPHGAFAVNVMDEESVEFLLEQITARYGGVDLVVSNAGVLKAGSVKKLSLRDFRFVTDVNYTGFFLMTKHSAPVMNLQHRGAAATLAMNAREGAPGTTETGLEHQAATPSAPYLTDIVEINSKSGLEGSNRNSAYAGSKFGGIGLVQSFALELVEQGTKVNAICPGNYLDGPLWSDPENGLFVQYLRAGKVPGAQSIADVRTFYESKVPLNRGCTGPDVVRAIAYVVGQEYETGQAVPVTGGQVMLS